MRIVERKVSLDEYRNEHFKLYREPGFWDAVDCESLAANGVADLVLLDLQGPFVGVSQDFSAKTRQLVAGGERVVVVNLEAVTEVDSLALGQLVSCYVAIKRSGGTMPLVNAPEHFRRLMTTMKFL